MTQDNSDPLKQDEWTIEELIEEGRKAEAKIQYDIFNTPDLVYTPTKPIKKEPIMDPFQLNSRTFSLRDSISNRLLNLTKNPDDSEYIYMYLSKVTHSDQDKKDAEPQKEKTDELTQYVDNMRRARGIEYINTLLNQNKNPDKNTEIQEGDIMHIKIFDNEEYVYINFRYDPKFIEYIHNNIPEMHREFLKATEPNMRGGLWKINISYWDDILNYLDFTYANLNIDYMDNLLQLYGIEEE